MSKILIFNWKMNPATPREASALAQASDHENIVVVPPFPFLETVGDTLVKAKLGAQDLFWEKSGAFTGEVSAEEIKNIGAAYVIIGHSERRHKLGETDEAIAKKMKVAVDADLIPILCVGETEAEKNSGKWQSVIKRQLEKGLSLITKSSKLKAQSLFVAYEPVWAIGTGDPETPDHAAQTIAFIKSVVNRQLSIVPKVLYGGSVDSKNLADFLKEKEIDGALVGGASLSVSDVGKMIEMV